MLACSVDERRGAAAHREAWGVEVRAHDRCLYADFANSNHNLYFPPGDQTFVSKRVGDGEVVQGARVH